MTLHKLRKALMQGRFFYVGRLSHFALWRINGSALRHSILDLVTIIIATPPSNYKKITYHRNLHTQPYPSRLMILFSA